MSYLKPQWWLRPFAFMARCQSKNIHDQYAYGARMFDLRVVFDKSGKPYFAHGLASYKDEDVYETLEWLQMFSRMHEYRTGELIVVRVLNERNNNQALFHDFCTEINERFQDIQFCGFRNKNGKGMYWNWSIRGGNGMGLGDTGEYHKESKDSSCHIVPDDKFRITFIDKYSSDNCKKHNNGHCTGRWYDDLCPWLYALLHNKKNRSTFADTPGFLMQDFVGVY